MARPHDYAGRGLDTQSGCTGDDRPALYVCGGIQISGLKLYAFDATPKRGWWFDDEKLAYPIWEACRKLGIKNIGCHKGIPFGQFMARYAHAEDFDAVADDFLDMNWIVYHAAWSYQKVDFAAVPKGSIFWFVELWANTFLTRSKREIIKPILHRRTIP